MLALRFSTLKGLCRPVLASGLRTLQPQCARFGTVIEVAPEENRMALKKPTPNQLMSDKLLLQDMTQAGLHVRKVFHNSSAAELYEQALKHEKGSFISDTGALMVSSGTKTGRSPSDKRIVKEPSSEKDVWWGPVNMELEEQSFLANRERAIDYLNCQDRLFVVDAFAGWEEDSRIRIRVVTSRAYHALFMQNMLVKATDAELADFRPDFTIYNAGVFPANRLTSGMTSAASVAFHFSRGEAVVLGTQYAGEMKKGVFTLMMYLMPKRNMLCLHTSANLGPKGDVSLFFGLSGTGKTTLSADPNRMLIGDDEHVWHDKVNACVCCMFEV
eukprot:Platyproteum_vivax@DN4390_c0_g1_i12.p1